MFRKIKNKFHQKIYDYKWKKKNKNNFTSLRGVKDISRVSVGRGTYGHLRVFDFSPNTGKTCLKIGNYCSFGHNIQFLLGGGHKTDTISTYPFAARLCGKEESIEKGDIVINDDVWMGNNVTVLSGVTVGKGAVIGAGAVVVKDIPPYAIAGGVPAKVIKYRFSDDVINELEQLDFSKLTFDIAKENLDLLEKKPSKVTLDQLKRLLQ